MPKMRAVEMLAPKAAFEIVERDIPDLLPTPCAFASRLAASATAIR